MSESQSDLSKMEPSEDGGTVVGKTNMVQLRPYDPNRRIQKNTPLPNYVAASVREIDFELLQEQHGSRVLFIDLDNTLTKVGSNVFDDPETERYLRNLLDKGILKAIYLATRSGRSVKGIEEAIGAKRFVHPSGYRKPSPKYFDELLKEAGCKPEEAVMVGDRVTHDISGAEAAGIVTVLVKPIGKGVLKGWVPSDFFGTYQREKKAQHKVQEELRKLGHSLP